MFSNKLKKETPPRRTLLCFVVDLLGKNFQHYYSSLSHPSSKSLSLATTYKHLSPFSKLRFLFSTSKQTTNDNHIHNHYHVHLHHHHFLVIYHYYH